MITSLPFVFKETSSSFENVSSWTLLYTFSEPTEGTEGYQEELRDAKEEAIDEEKAGQESEAGLNQWSKSFPSGMRIFQPRIRDCSDSKGWKQGWRWKWSVWKMFP